MLPFNCYDTILLLAVSTPALIFAFFYIYIYFVQDTLDDLPKWEKKYQILTESSKFLVEQVKEPVAAEIKEQVLFTTKRWQDVSSQVQVKKCS